MGGSWGKAQWGLAKKVEVYIMLDTLDDAQDPLGELPRSRQGTKYVQGSAAMIRLRRKGSTRVGRMTVVPSELTISVCYP